MSFIIRHTPQTSRVLGHIKKVPDATKRGVRQGFFKVGHNNVEHVRMLIRKPPKTGRLYRIPGRKRRHRASAPGEAPANLTGNLANSAGFQLRGWSEMGFGERAEYARALELGYAPRNLEPRPHLLRTVREQRRNNDALFYREMQREILRRP